MHGGARINKAERLYRQPTAPLKPAAEQAEAATGHGLVSPPTPQGGRIKYV